MKILDTNTFETILNGIFGNASRKILLDGRTKNIRKDDILIYLNENKIYFYKAKKDGNISIPTNEYCDKLSINNSDSNFSYEEIKKKILNG